MKTGSSAGLIGVLFAACLAVAPVTRAQDVPARAPTPDSSQLLQFLNRTVSWYRLLAVEQAAATEPDDQLIVYDNRQIADQAVRLAFDFARAQADAAAGRTVESGPGNASAAPAGDQALGRMVEKVDRQFQAAQAELDSDRQQVASASGRRRQELESQIAELQAELKLAAARKDAVHGMADFVAGTSANGVGATGLRAQIEALASSIPAAAANPATGAGGGTRASPLAAPAPITSGQADFADSWALMGDVFAVFGKVRAINSITEQTTALSDASREIRAPFVAELRELTTKGDDLAAQADTADPALLAREKQQLDALAADFKRISSAVTPLSKQSVLLKVYERNLANWRDLLEARSQADLKRLGFRLALLALVLAAVIGAAELWRRGVYRYVHEPRRRRQFLLLRKVVLGTVIALIIAFGLAGRLGSVLTFAGLLTAGVAVALQNVILSFVGYFFLIGKFGIRVGDRVQIDGVAGEVVDIGLARLHVMELGGGGFDTPTGRVVAFSNSIVFQPGAGLFRQIPGTNFVWHEIAFTVPGSTDAASIKETLLRAISTVFSDYGAELDRQYRELARTVTSISADALQPRIRLRTVSGGVQAVIRYPVEGRFSAEVDQRVSRAVLEAFEGNPDVKIDRTQPPEIHLRTDLPAADGTNII